MKNFKITLSILGPLTVLLYYLSNFLNLDFGPDAEVIHLAFVFILPPISFIISYKESGMTAKGENKTFLTLLAINLFCLFGVVFIYDKLSFSGPGGGASGMVFFYFGIPAVALFMIILGLIYLAIDKYENSRN